MGLFVQMHQKVGASDEAQLLEKIFRGDPKPPKNLAQVFASYALHYLGAANTFHSDSQKCLDNLGEAADLIGRAYGQAVITSFPSMLTTFARIDAKKGLAQRWSKLNNTKKFVVDSWFSGKWATRSACASAIEKEVIRMAKVDGISLAPTNVTRQIKDWIRENDGAQ